MMAALSGSCIFGRLRFHDAGTGVVHSPVVPQGVVSGRLVIGRRLGRRRGRMRCPKRSLQISLQLTVHRRLRHAIEAKGQYLLLQFTEGDEFREAVFSSHKRVYALLRPYSAFGSVAFSISVDNRKSVVADYLAADLVWIAVDVPARPLAACDRLAWLLRQSPHHKAQHRSGNHAQPQKLFTCHSRLHRLVRISDGGRGGRGRQRRAPRRALFDAYRDAHLTPSGRAGRPAALALP